MSEKNEPSVRRYRADHALLPDGWDEGVGLSVGEDGMLLNVQPRVDEDWGQRIDGAVVPGMPNLHSHAFQRAMAGQAEVQRDPEDSFWTWRETMYAHAGSLSVEDQYRQALRLYSEMLAAGYTWVCEFHYLHHRPDGSANQPPEAMSLALIQAAQECGIGLSLLPVLYMSSGFDGAPVGPRQKRFALELDGYLKLLEVLRGQEHSRLCVGAAMHSLRAVPAAAMDELLAAESGSRRPLHIHIAEQQAEVDQCLATRGQRPVAWLFDNAPVDGRWCLIHATHMNESECHQLARSEAVAGLCPSTEANLGDGLFPLLEYVEAGGHMGIGSDSHISVNVIEELRWLEYGQRLHHQKRNIMAWPGLPHTGENLWRLSCHGGAQAAGAPIGALKAGHHADWLVLDTGAWPLSERPRAQWMDSLVFAGHAGLIRETWTAGCRR